MQRIITRVRREIFVFQRLKRSIKLLLFCLALISFAGSFLGVFLNIYFWRALHRLEAVALFNLFFFVGLPIGFIANGFLVKKISYVAAFRAGIMALGLFPLIIMGLQENAFRYLGLLGLVNGFSDAFYWANLNIFIYDLTSDTVRGYFTGLHSALGSAIGIVTPPIVGFLIGVFGQEWLRLSVRHSYYLSFSIATFLFLTTAVVAGKITAARERLEFSLPDINLKNKSQNWGSIRLMSIASGFPSGIFALTWSLLAFEFFGRELEVGWFNGFLGIIGVLAAYFAGRYAKPERRMRTTIIGTAFYFLGATFFGLNFTIPAFYLLGIFVGIGDHFLWAVEFPVLMKEMEKGYLPGKQRYVYWVDREMFLNIGRVLGMIIFIALVSLFAFKLVYQIMFILIALIALVFLATIVNLIQTQK